MTAAAKSSVVDLIGRAEVGSVVDVDDELNAALTKPVADLTPADLYQLIFWKVGVDVVMPIVLKQLRGNLLLQANYADGDLLGAALQVSPDFWASHQKLWLDMSILLDRLDAANELVAKSRRIFDMATQPTTSRSRVNS